MAFCQVLALTLALLVSDFNGQLAIDFWFVVILFFGGPTVGAILVSPGCRWPHCLMAVGSSLFGFLVFNFSEPVPQAFYALAIGFAVILSGWMRWTKTPPYRIRPSRSGHRASISIQWLMAITAVIAALIAGIRIADPDDDVLKIVAMFLPSCAAMAFGSWLAARKRVGVRWWAVVIGSALLSLAYLIQTNAFSLRLDWVLPLSFLQLEGTDARFLMVAPAATLLITTIIHRCQVLINLSGRRCRPQ